MSMVRMIVGGVDTHADTHVAAAVDANGGILGIESFPLTRPVSRNFLDGSRLMARSRWWVLRAPGRGVSVLPGSSTTTKSQWLRLIVRTGRTAVGLGSLMRLMQLLRPGLPCLVVLW